jgi:hypothetical protein
LVEFKNNRVLGWTRRSERAQCPAHFLFPLDKSR